MKNVTINMRTTKERLALIDRGAAIEGITRSEFIRRAATKKARKVLSENNPRQIDQQI